MLGIWVAANIQIKISTYALSQVSLTRLRKKKKESGSRHPLWPPRAMNIFYIQASALNVLDGFNRQYLISNNHRDGIFNRQSQTFLRYSGNQSMCELFGT